MTRPVEDFEKWAQGTGKVKGKSIKIKIITIPLSVITKAIKKLFGGRA